MKSFPPEIAERLGYYVYSLIDPRGGQPFYIGMGSGNQVFHHLRGGCALADSSENDPNPLPGRRNLIEQIQAESLEVIHIVHRHGMDRDIAVEVAAALIDAVPGLANAASGHGSNDRGPARIEQLRRDYATEEIEFVHRAVVIKIRRSAVEANGGNVYEAVRGPWKLDARTACKGKCVLAIVEGVCRGVFVADDWIPIDEDQFAFEGSAAPKMVCDMYVGKRLPARMRKPGMVDPVLYSWKLTAPA